MLTLNQQSTRFHHEYAFSANYFLKSNKPMALGLNSNLNGVVGTFAFVVWLSMKGLVVWAQHIQLLGASPNLCSPFCGRWPCF